MPLNPPNLLTGSRILAIPALFAAFREFMLRTYATRYTVRGRVVTAGPGRARERVVDPPQASPRAGNAVG